MTKEIPLTKGKVALVDDADYEWLSQWKWCIRTTRAGYIYAVRGTTDRKILSMHRAILQAPQGVLVDHRDGDGLNNTRQNLRLATHSENLQNTRRSSKSHSPYKGVSLYSGKWIARICAAEQRIYLGGFETPEAAARAYDAAACQYFGEFARLNFSE